MTMAFGATWIVEHKVMRSQGLYAAWTAVTISLAALLSAPYAYLDGQGCSTLYDLAQSIGRYTQQRHREIQHDSAQTTCLPVLLRPH